MDNGEHLEAVEELNSSFDLDLLGKVGEIVESQQSKRKLAVGGYLYNWSTNARFWRCDKRTSASKCKATLKTDLNNVVKSVNHRHSHFPDPTRVIKNKMVSKLNDAAKQAAPYAVTSQSIVRRVESESKQEDMRLLPNHQALLQRVRRQKGSTIRHMEPKSKFFAIPVEFSKTPKNEPFVYRDVTFDLAGTQRRIIICTTPTLLSYFAKSNLWLADGTFKIVPTVFYQLYTLCGNVNSDRMYPMIFAFMDGKFKINFFLDK